MPPVAKENTLAFERVVEEFENISPSNYPDELMTACCDAPNYVGAYIKSLEVKPHDPNGPQPADVDSVNRFEDYRESVQTMPCLRTLVERMPQHPHGLCLPQVNHHVDVNRGSEENLSDWRIFLAWA